MTAKITTYVQDCHGVPTLFINGSPVFASAYICYLDTHARYEDFAKAGYRMYSFPSYFAGRGINIHSGIGPFRKGIFDSEGIDDFTVFDRDVRQILSACKEALIFPRVCLDMPEWWEKKYPDEVNITIDGKVCRESFSSSRWKKDASAMLLDLIKHIDESDYRDHIIGYHLAAGGTEEWVHFANHMGGFGPAVLKGYRRFLRKKYADDVEKLRRSFHNSHITFDTIYLPENFDLYSPEGKSILENQTNENMLEFLTYRNDVVADAIAYFSKLTKDATQNRLVVGAFYGYITEIVDSRNGHHAIIKLLNDENIDFFCSPNSYMGQRAPGIDWPGMSVLDSVKLHGKLWMSECDTRTFLTRPLSEHRPDIAPDGFYKGGVWEGPRSKDVSKWLIRKNFGRNLITGSGQWWFDMWGGWFADEELMAELKSYLPIQKESIKDNNRASISELAVIVDEDAFRYINYGTPTAYEWVYMQRHSLGLCGAPYDIFDVSDAYAIEYKRYKLILFLNICVENDFTDYAIREAKRQCVNLCFTYLPCTVKDGNIDLRNVSAVTGFGLKNFTDGWQGGIASDKSVTGCDFVYGIPLNPVLSVEDPEAVTAGRFAMTTRSGLAYKNIDGIKVIYSALPNLPVGVLRWMFAISGIHTYIETDDVLYANSNFACIHASSAGVKEIRLPWPKKITCLFEKECSYQNGDLIRVNMAAYETCLFRLDEIE